MSNTTQNLPCVLCGTPGNIVREAPNSADCRVKCNNNRCGHTYSKQDSLDAQAANQIPENAVIPEVEEYTKPVEEVMPLPPPEPSPSKKSDVTGTVAVPRTPAFVFISKSKDRVEFVTKKELKKAALRWETDGSLYTLYELHPKQVTAKIEFN